MELASPIILAGTPAVIKYGGTYLVTNALAATKEWEPTRPPCKSIIPAESLAKSPTLHPSKTSPGGGSDHWIRLHEGK